MPITPQILNENIENLRKIMSFWRTSGSMNKETL